MRTIPTRGIYETNFDEGVRTESSANQCPECDGRITTNAVETLCEDCGLVIDGQRIDHGLEWRTYDDEERERTGAPLTAARHDRGLSMEIGRSTDAKGNELRRSDDDSRKPVQTGSSAPLPADARTCVALITKSSVAEPRDRMPDSRPMRLIPVNQQITLFIPQVG